MTFDTRKPAELTSSKNPLLKDVKRASLRGLLTSDGLQVAESFHLLEEAIRSQREIPIVLCAEQVRHTVEAHVRGIKTIRVISMPPPVFQEVAGTETSQGVIALVRPRTWNLDDMFRGRSMVVVLDGVQDPGNAGAVVRSAEAFGATGILFLKGSSSPHNPKTLRASAGSLFRIPYLAGIDDEMVLAALAQHQVTTYATVSQGGELLAQADLAKACAFIIGSEGKGVSAKFSKASTAIRIPTVGVESLNAAVAAGIILYEARRQRTLRA